MSTPPFLTLPRCARAVRLDTTRGTFAALEALPDGPLRATALLVPGFTGSKEDFIALLEPLSAAGVRVVAVDQRGQHETGGPADEAAYQLPELGLDVLALTEAVAAESGPPHLLGHSFGGYVVREAVLAAGEPAPWRSLTLLSTGPAAIEPNEAARTKLLLDALTVLDLEAIWQVMKEMEEGSGDQVEPPAPEVAAFLHRRWVSNVPQSLAAMGRRLIAEPDRVPELAAAALPKLVLSGDRDYAWPVPWQSAMAERLGARRVVIEGSGHSPNAERPAETARALLDFWATFR
ncbi:alpha/beta fold hydrolase [Peterkaempfera bronchialis]|uniref:Alpha/beta hydrolase n=1 Tax=Peterkaempfera bronchialis TaxID=2126346 RepID=A0A345T021_9ACTN|nr:alpha/beta fold hydrolase [Peterkaempfera bronchialis]AXI79326.1 alpha/beta hydrolase [Peterkaempfera bronchialis]